MFLGGETHSHEANRACVPQVALLGARQGSTTDAASLDRDYATAFASEAIMAEKASDGTQRGSGANCPLPRA